jgi:epoxyqueuosine reductase QueG
MFGNTRNHDLLKKFALSAGAGLFGVADIMAIRDEFQLPKGTRDILDKAVCLGVGLSSLVLSEINGEPTKLYFHHYKTANLFLDRLAFAVANWIQERGFQALPIPASQITDWDLQKAHLSHKKIGYLAGLGWLGRNNLLVSRKFGAQFRMVTVLTNMDLKVDKPLSSDCGRCLACIASCPAAAIQNDPKDFRHILCFDKVKSFQRQNIVGQFICGICVKACGRK